MTATAPSTRVPLRLRMSPLPRSARLDGGWWPQSRDLTLELADLVDHFPAAEGRVVRAVFSPPDWDGRARRIKVARGYVKAGSFPGDDTHVLHVRTSNRTALDLLVVPPGLSSAQGEESLLAAATPGNSRTATELLETVSESVAADPADRWTDEGGAWWGENRQAPSHRVPAQAVHTERVVDQPVDQPATLTS